MKNKRILSSALFLVIFLMGMISFSFAQNQKTPNSKFELKVYCNDAKAKTTIEKELLKLNGVKTASFDIKTKILTTTFDPGVCDRLKINAVVEKLGYETMITKEEQRTKKACSDAEKNKAAPVK